MPACKGGGVGGAVMGDDLLLMQLGGMGCVDAFDLMLGKKIQQKDGCLLGVYVSRAFRQGHMAVRIGDEVMPSVQSVFSDDGINVIDDAMAASIEKSLKRQMTECPGRLVSEGEVAALPRAHAVEVSLAREVARLSMAEPFVKVNRLMVGDELNAGQQAAVVGAGAAAMCLVTGGPGTGKTYTASAYLRALARASSVRPLRVAVVAPTGRAVQTLFAGIKKMSGDEVVLEAKTIHSLVSQQSGTFLPYHVVIVDEGSMIGSELMLKLMLRLHSGTRVVMLGDADQLPSIDPGQPFFELLKAAQRGVIRHFSLQGCQRTTSNELLELADAVRRGDGQGFEMMLGRSTGDVTFVECMTDADWQRAEKVVERDVMAPWRGKLSLNAATALLRKAALLTSCRKGYWGTDSVNSRMGWQKEYTPVVSTKNSYHLGVMNGDIGILERSFPQDQIHFHHCTVPTVLVPMMERAFAMTVHKSQGGEFETVVVVIPPGALLDRRLLYTAITRAKRRLVVIGQKTDVVGAVIRKEERVSTLSSRLQASALC